MRNRGIRGEQWSTCQRCGVEYPMSHLTSQLGLVVCKRSCVDDLSLMTHAIRVGEKLNAGIQTEGADTRFIDAAWFNTEELI